MKKTILSLSVVAAFGIGMVSCSNSVKDQMNKAMDDAWSSSSEDEESGEESSEDLFADDETAPAEDASELPTTLEAYGVTYECKYNPADNDAYLANFDLAKVMQDKDEMIKAWEIYTEEQLRYQFAAGDSGLNAPGAFSRYQEFSNTLSPYDNNDNPVYYVKANSWDSSEWTPEQFDEIKSFKNATDQAFNDWRAAKNN